MAKAKKNNLLYIGIAAAVVIAVVIGVIVAVKGNSGNNGGDSDNGDRCRNRIRRL